MATKISHQATIIKGITKMVETFTTSVKGGSNSDEYFARYFFWDILKSYADKQKTAALDALIEKEFLEDNFRAKTEGEYTIGESSSFFMTDKVSKPRKTFDEDVLAEALNRKYKVPKPIVKEMVNNSKVDGSATHTIKIVER